MAIEWNEGLSVGVADFDADHQRLFELFNRLEKARREPEGADIGRILEELLNYSKFHFAREEKALADNGYLGLDSHRGEHRIFTMRVADLHERFRSGKADNIEANLLVFLERWITRHILGSDKDYTAFLMSRGIH